MSASARSLKQNASKILDRISNSFKTASTIIHKNRGTFLLLQGGYWGLVAIATGLALQNPELQKASLARVNQQLDDYSLGRFVAGAYKDGNLPLAIAVTFCTNLTLGALLITLPSSVLPFSGIVLAGYRAFEWGLIFAPNEGYGVTLPHLLTMVLEGQAYILAALGAWIQGRGLFQHLQNRPTSGTKSDQGSDIDARQQAVLWPDYWQSFKYALSLYSPITALLAIAAIWEAYEVIHLPEGWIAKS